MNAKERFIATLTFEKTDRPFRWETPAVWPATIKKWHKEGLPEHITCSNITDSEVYDYFGMDKLGWLPFPGGWITDPFHPMFEAKTIEDDGVSLTIQDADGIVKKIMKDNPDTSMPQFLKFPGETPEDYEKNISWRLDPKDEGRFPADWSARVREYAVRDYPLGMFVIGPFGHIRNLMGDEIMMYKLYDEPDFIRMIMKNWKDFYIAFLTRVAKDVTPDFLMVWEDMCYNGGPLISPEAFKEFMAPYLKEVLRCAKELGIVGRVVDNDGDCRKMLPIYLDCGANAFYPFECQAGMDILALRKEYGKQFAIIGGLRKGALAESREAVMSEIDRKVPAMLKQGGYIPMLDHSVPTNVSLEMFKFFLTYMRK